MDVIEASAVVTMLFAVGIGVQHLYDRYAPKGLYVSTRALAASAPDKIGAAVENALVRVSERERAILEASAKEAQAAYEQQVKGAEMSVVRAVGVDKQLHARVDKLLGDAILGPAMPILRQFAPGLADALEENPQLLDVVVQNPLFKKYVAPRIEQYLGGQVAQSGSSEATGWGT